MDRAKWNRLAVICDLVKRSKSDIGRTALMKFLYLLKEIRGVPLEYRFSLYTYGPFDSSVLDDLRYAESLDAVKSTLVRFSGGYGYVFSSGPALENITFRAQDFLSENEGDIAWVVDTFGGRSASELEMIGTIVYVDRGALGRGEENTLAELAKKTIEIKPHLDPGVVKCEAERLFNASYLKAIAA